MNKWIYIKSDSIIDAYAVASVLNGSTNNNFYLIRKVLFAKLFNTHPRILKKDFCECCDNSQLITINPNGIKDFKELLCHVAEHLEVEYQPTSCSLYIPTMPEFVEFSHIDIILMFSEDLHEPLDLSFLDMAVNYFKTRQLCTISAGTMSIPCIRGSKDYRGLVTWEYIPVIAAQNKSVLILTNNVDYAALCKVVGLNYIVLQSEDGIMSSDDQQLRHPHELINLINQKIS